MSLNFYLMMQSRGSTFVQSLNFMRINNIALLLIIPVIGCADANMYFNLLYKGEQSQ